METLELKVRQLSQQLKLKEDELQAEKQKYVDLLTRNDNDRLQQNELKEQRDGLRSEVDQLKSEKEELETKILVCAIENERLHNLVEKAYTEMNNIESQHREILDNATSRQNDQGAQIEQAQLMIGSLSAQLQSLQQENEFLRAESANYKQLPTITSELENKLRFLEAENQRLVQILLQRCISAN